MPKTKKNRDTRRAAIKGDNKESDRRQGLSRRTALIISLAVILVVATIIFAIVYPTSIAPFRHVVVTVDDAEYRMDYFLKLCRLTGDDPMGVLDTVVHQHILLNEAEGFGLKVTQEELDDQLFSVAAGSSGNITQAEFREWYRQIINMSGLTEKEYLDIVRVTVLTDKYNTYLANNVPTTGEQVHLYAIFLDTEEEAIEVIERWEAGESFSDLAVELSKDQSTAELGGEMGWFPRGSLDALWEQDAFNLEVGTLSDPLPMYADEQDVSSGDAILIQGFYVIYVPERQIREISEESLEIIKANALMDWLWDRMSAYDVKYHGFNGGGYDSVTDAWVRWQLQKDSVTEEEAAS